MGRDWPIALPGAPGSAFSILLPLEALAVSREGLRALWVSFAGLLLTAAAYTKQTAVVAPLIAALLVLLGTQRARDARVLFFTTLGLCLAIFLLLYFAAGLAAA